MNTQLGQRTVAQARVTFMLELLLAVDAMRFVGCGRFKSKCFCVPQLLIGVSSCTSMPQTNFTHHCFQAMLLHGRFESGTLDRTRESFLHAGAGTGGVPAPVPR